MPLDLFQFFFSWSFLLLHPFLLFWLHVGHYVWETLEVLSDAVFSRVSPDADLQWEQSCLFTQTWVTWGWGVLVSWVSAAFTHLPPPTPGRSPLVSPSGSLGCLPGPLLLGRSWSPPSVSWAPQGDWYSVLSQFGQTVGYVFCASLFLGSLVSNIQTDLSGPCSNFCLPSPRNCPELC